MLDFTETKANSIGEY